MSTQQLEVAATPGHAGCRINPPHMLCPATPSVPKGQGRACANTCHSPGSKQMFFSGMRVEVMIPISSQMLEGLIDTVHCPLPSKLRSWDRIEQQACVRNRGCKRQDWMSWNNSWVSCTDYKTTRWDTVMLPGTVTAWSFTVKWQLLPNVALH